MKATYRYLVKGLFEMLKKPSILIGTAVLLWASLSFADVDTKVKWGGEYRLRTYVADNLTFGSSEKQDLYNHRLLLKGEMAPNDVIEAHFSFNIHQLIGGKGRRGFSGVENTEDDSQQIQILTAYADWHLGSSFFLQLGRMDLNWGNEVVVSRNMDDQRPYAFDGMVFGYDSEAFLFNAGALRVGDWDQSLGPAATIDPDESAYFVTLDFKSFGKVLETAKFFFLRLQSADFIDSANSINIPGSSLNRLGFALAGSKGKFFYQLDYVNLLGSYNGGADIGARAWMGHFNLGLNLGENNPGSVYVIGHFDSGDDVSSTETDEGYRPIYYNHHKYAGLMDLLAWGNLTYYGLGARLLYKNRIDFTAQVLRFTLTDTSKGPNSISYLGYGDNSSLVSEDVSKNSNGEISSDLGTEFDFVIKRDFRSKAYVELILGVFLPDSYFEAYGRSEKIYSFRLSTGFSF